MAEHVVGARTCGEAAEWGDDALEADIVNEILVQVTARLQRVMIFSTESPTLHRHQEPGGSQK